MILHMVLLILGIFGVSSYPQRRQLILVPAHEIFQQRIQEPIQHDNNLFLYQNHLAQKQGYAPQNGFVYLRDGATEAPEEPGYFETIYAYLTGNSVTQPPATEQPAPTQSTPETAEPVPEEPKPTTSESETSTENEATTPESEQKDDTKPIKIQQDTSKLEQFEPDAEVIPDTLKTPSNPQRPDVPLLPYPANPAFIPGQRFYILNNPQFTPNNPGLIYPNTQFRPQPAVRYPGFQQRFLILGQPNIGQPNFIQPPQGNNQQVIYLNGNSNEQLRSRQSQRLQIPPLSYPMFGRQIQQPNFNAYSSVSEQGNSVIASQDQEGQIPDNFNNYAPLIQSHYGFNQHNVEDYADKQQPAGKLQFTRFLQESSDDTTSSFSVMYNSKSGIQQNDDSVAIDAESTNTKNDKDVEDNSKVELSHKDLNNDPALARADPHAIALSGKGGTAQSTPMGTAIVGPSGIAISDPIATALAGPLAKKTSSKDN